jgi:hypothetical protein
MEIHAQPRTAADVREAIDESNDELRYALEQLERRTRWEISVGRRIAENAPVVLIAGFLCGALLGAATARR